ncbi:DUF1385 domain-containing protein [Desulfothermobacter acidiphilus]|uniref:DUF1385 domain-containing protein n=1 Tax=Desulfothermobacter acidiphilus TaxID=1938353 RepID=UPI003F8B5D2C
MRGPSSWAVAVRRPDGSIAVRREEIPDRPGGWRFPLVRGVVLLYEALVLGVKALSISAAEAAGEEEQLSRGEVAATIAFGLGAGVLLFVLFPAGAAYFFRQQIPAYWLQNLLEGLVRLVVFLLYLWAISWLPDIRRVFAYHGAEHRVINAYEAGAPLLPDAVAVFPVIHRRCGTSFLLLVLLLSIFFFSLVGQGPLWWRLLSRLLLLPLLAGVSYEVLRWSSGSTSPWLRPLVAPGLWLQRLTTREPDGAQVEVALAALQAILPEGGEGDVGETRSDRATV